MKLLVFMLDALCASDAEFMKTLPHFSELFARGAYVRSIRPVHPALTYCCHTSILTGTYVGRHGICHNEKLARGGKSGAPWHALRADVKGPTLLDYAREAGMTTCSLSWPVSGGADYTYNMPMIVPYDYTGYHPERWLEGTATQNLMDRYFWKYGRYIKGKDRSLDLFTMALAPDIIEDFGQPDVMLVKMCDLDSVRHTWGVYHEKTREQLRRHDEELGVLMQALRRFGDPDDTNIVVLGDHGQTDVRDVLFINRLLADNGFIRTGADGGMTSFDAFAHSTGLACFIELRDPADAALAKRVRGFLEDLKKDEKIKLRYVLDAREAEAQYGLRGPFDFVIESDRDISFSERLDTDTLWGSTEPGDHKTGAATHGSRPDRAETTLFVACGPGVRPGVVLDSADMVDEAPTMAKLLGLSMKDTDGRVLEEMLQ
ncbi:MAG: alkaline phosphatase family protein [Oscillospiraceae bacterium]|nr:alkaline phosphatase family protein [Oscillospiraceae bacterium]